MAVAVTHDEAARRFVITVDEEQAGFTEYRTDAGERAFLHTEIGDRFEGQGLGSKLIGGALDQTRDEGLTVAPLCPFVRTYIERHPEHLDLVPADRRDSYNLTSN